MGRRKYRIDEKVIKRRLKEGRGRGKGTAYHPWITVFDLPSLGCCYQILGHTTNRDYHLLSHLEAQHFHCNDFSNQVLDIREQFPLFPRDETIEIAKDLGVKHPADPISKCQIVMTTDQLLTVPYLGGEKYQAISIKYSHELEKPRVQEKLEIERRYWQKRKIDFLVRTEKDINRIKVANLIWIHPYYRRTDLYPLTDASIASLSKELTDRVLTEEVSLCHIANLLDKKNALPIGSCLAIARHLLATQQWVVNLEVRVNPRERLQILESSVK